MRDPREVARVSTIAEGELLADLLNRHGVRAWLPDRAMLAAAPHLHIAIGGVRVLAPPERIDQARDLARRAMAGEFTADEDDDGWRSEAANGWLGEVRESEFNGLMGPARRIGGWVVLGLLLSSPLIGCPTAVG